MPVPWMPDMCTDMLDAPPVVRQQARVTQKIDEDLVVSAESMVYDPVAKTTIFSRGVVATYGLTTVRADRLELFMAEADQRARASGNVVIEDPEAEISAQDLEFTWKTGARAGKAKNVMMRIGHAHIRAKEADLQPNLWTFTGVEGTNCPELYWVKSPRLVIQPGKKGKLEDPSFYLRGSKIVTLPDRNFNLDPRTQGVSIPSLSVRRGQGLGVAWDAGFLLNENTNLYINAAAFKGSYPGFGVTATRSSVPVEKASSILTPGSELGERFRFGYLESIEIDTPEQERRILSTPRNSVSVASLWNQGVSGRTIDTTVSKALEGTFESGGLVGAKPVTRTDQNGEKSTTLEGGIAYLGQLRLQHIRQGGGPFVSRAVVIGSAEAPTLKFGPKLGTIGRVDTSQFLGKSGFGWVRAFAGLYYEPTPQLRVAGGVVTSKSYGTADFFFDQLTAERGFHLRADLDLGSTKISYMTKYDTRLKWYDREYIISQVAGCFEPFILYRQFPSDYRFGLRLRLDNFYDILQRRNFRRTKAPATKTVISDAVHP